MNGYEFALESDEAYDESDEAYDESDELAERRRGRRVPRISPGRLPSPGGLVRPPAPTGNVVTRAEFNASMARIDKKIETNAEAIKKVTAQSNKINTELGAVTSRLDKQVGELRKEVKKQAETSLLLTLLSKPPGIKVTPQKVQFQDTSGTTKEVEVVGKVEVEKQSNLLPLVLLSSQGGGLGGGDSSNMLILALALSGQV
jgi:hypothetical protein